jgi:hypothetical protein
MTIDIVKSNIVLNESISWRTYEMFQDIGDDQQSKVPVFNGCYLQGGALVR